MQVECARCNRIIEYAGERPSFCAYCGRPLSATEAEPARLLDSPDSTAAYQGAAATVARSDDSLDGIPDRVAGYRLIKPLGRGGMGAVFEAEDSQHGRRVALKLISRRHVTSSEAVERFRQEGRLASAIAHPRCVFVLAADEDAGRPYIVMELMPGLTLQNLVEQSGPMSPEEAVVKTLDVIEGLQEAHHVGVIHRDVKPSNCFLDSDGRVKVGDFGLSKSLSGDSHLTLTRTGAFIGTPLYASPEQIKGDGVDERTDVYSVAATLYYLLAGRPPFMASDAAAVLARIVSETPPSLRTLRPEITPALESVISRGMDRDRDRRYRSMAEIRAALLPFAPGQLSIGAIGLRAAAYLFDFSLFLVTVALVMFLTGVVGEVYGLNDSALHWSAAGAYYCVVLLWLHYFTMSEGIWGASLGKRLVRLRVAGVPGGGPPGVLRAGQRALVLYACIGLVVDALSWWLDTTDSTRWLVISSGASLIAAAIGWGVLASTMRASNGFRGLHELVSRTRTVRLPRPDRRRAPRGRRMPQRPELLRSATSRPVGVMQSVGPYKVRGAIKWGTSRKVLLAEDSTLKRPVWVVLQPKGSSPPPPARRELSRASRPRWLAGGEQAEGRWDAFEAPVGCSLADLAGPAGLSWGDARPIIEDLTEELVAACSDGTIPPAVSVEQVWIQPDGRAQFVDALAEESAFGKPPIADDEPQRRALNLLRGTSALALEGGRHRSGSQRIQSPVPCHASAMFERLPDGPNAYPDLLAFRADLVASRDRPTEIDRGSRAVQLVIQSLLHAIPWGGMAVLALFILSAIPDDLGKTPLEYQSTFIRSLVYSLIPIVTWTIWSACTRGGLVLGLMGSSLVLGDGRPAPRWRCAWRTFVIWLLPTASLCAALWLGRFPTLAWAAFASVVVAAILPIAGLPLALINPQRGPQDRLAGTYVVPK